MGKFVGFIFALAGVIVAWIWLYHGNTPINQMTSSVRSINLTSIAVIAGTLVIGLILLFFLFYFIFVEKKK